MVWYLIWVYLNFVVEVRHVVDVRDWYLTSIVLCWQLIQIVYFLLYSYLWGALDFCCITFWPRLLAWTWATATLAQIDSVISFQHIRLFILIRVPILRLLRFISERDLTYPPIWVDSIPTPKLLLAQRIILRIVRQPIVHIVIDAVLLISWCIGLQLVLF